MLTAILKDGNRITLTEDMNLQYLRKWRRTTTFYCPQCAAIMQLKVGEIMIPHFSHFKSAACRSFFSEGETRVHLLGKRKLYSFFKKRVEMVELEPFITELSQRPDLLVTNKNRKIPIEFQCSRISNAIIKDRTKGYLSINMQPIWILHTPEKLRNLPEGVISFRGSRFYENFFTHSASCFQFFTFDPLYEVFHYYSNLLHVSSNRYIGIHRTLPLSSQTFPFAQPKAPSTQDVTQYYKLYESIRNYYLKTRIYQNRKGINNRFLRSCYELEVRPEELPNWIGVPVRFNLAYRTNDCEWQLDLVHFMYNNHIQFKTLTNEHIKKYVSQSSEPNELKVKACMAYRDFLLLQEFYTFNTTIKKGAILQLISDRFLAK